MRLLHAGPDHVGGRLDRGGTYRLGSRDPRMDERQSLPLLVLSADPRSGAGRGEHAEGKLMRPFAYARAGTVSDALAAGDGAETAFLAGGTELLNWLRLGIAAPARVIDISRIGGLDRIEPTEGGGLRIGA